MPPKFSLQTVLDVRHSRVESLEIDLGRMQQERLQKENYLHTLYMAQDELYVKLHDRMTGELDLIEISMLRANINQLSLRIEKTNQAIAELDQAIVLKRQELIDAKKDEESLKILKNKEIERFVAEQNEKEKSFMDDVYISQGFRQRRNEMFL
jgi:flagellar export protein FliJ